MDTKADSQDARTAASNEAAPPFEYPEFVAYTEHYEAALTRYAQNYRVQFDAYARSYRYGVMWHDAANIADANGWAYYDISTRTRMVMSYAGFEHMSRTGRIFNVFR